MPVRRLLPLAAAAVALALATTSCANESAAVKVGDLTYSDKDFRDDLEVVAENENVQALYNAFYQDLGVQVAVPEVEGKAEGSYSQQFVGFMLSERIQAMFLEELFERENVELTDDELEQMRTQVESFLTDQGGKVSDLPKGFRDSLVANFARQGKQQSAGVSQEAFTELQDEFLDSIEINSRYGSFDPNQGLVPPPAPEGSGETDEQLPVQPSG